MLAGGNAWPDLRLRIGRLPDFAQKPPLYQRMEGGKGAHVWLRDGVSVGRLFSFCAEELLGVIPEGARARSMRSVHPTEENPCTSLRSRASPLRWSRC